MSRNHHALKSRIAAVLENESGVFAVAAIDLLTGEEYIVDSRLMRSASLIKLFIMVEAFVRISEGSLPPLEVIAFVEGDRVGGAGVLQQQPAGACFTVLELVGLMITESDNIATNLLINCLGADAINARIRKMGCADSCLRRHMMDFTAASEGRENMTSVTDSARALMQIYHNICADSAAGSAMLEILGRQTDRCKIPFFLPPGTVCRHKTGELPGAEHDAGIIYSPSGPYIAAIMSDGLADQERGRQLVARISREIYDFFSCR